MKTIKYFYHRADFASASEDTATAVWLRQVYGRMEIFYDKTKRMLSNSIAEGFTFVRKSESPSKV